MKYRKGVFIVIYLKNNNKIKYLLLKRNLHWKGWEFPKGGLETKESIITAVKREVKEETGQVPKNIFDHKHKGKYKYSKQINKRLESGQTYSLYSAHIENKKIKIDEREHSDYRWETFNKALRMLKWPNQRTSLRIVNKALVQ